MIFVILTSGCTYNGPNPLENTPATPTNSVTAETTQSVQSGITQPSVSWKDFYPDYTDQEKSKKIEEAKEEITRIFPDLDKASLEGKWDGEIDMWINPYPSTSFEDVTKDIKRIRVNPVTNEIISYSSTRYPQSMPGSSIVSFKSAVEKSLDLVEKIKGDEFMNRIGDDLILESTNGDSYLGTGKAILRISETHNGVEYQWSYISVGYNMKADETSNYSDNTVNESLLRKLTTLSPEPDITLDMAKEIFESKLKEQYDIDEIGIEYVEKDRRDFHPSLYWDDYKSNVYSENPESFRLIWTIPYTTEEQRTEEGYNEDIDAPKKVIIDAHTGDILFLNYKDELVINKTNY